MKNKKIAILLVITLVLMQIMPTYAATATGSNADAATPSNADEIIFGSDEFSEKLETLKSYSSIPVASASNAGVMLMSTGDDEPDINIWASVYDDNGNYIAQVKGVHKPLYDTDKYWYFQWPTRTYGKYGMIFYSVPKASLPSAGTYGAKWSMGQANIGLELSSCGINIFAAKNGVSTSIGTSHGVLDQSTGLAVCTGNVQIGYNTSLINLMTNIDNPGGDLDIVVPKSNPFEFTFAAQSGGTSVSPDVSTGNSKADDIIIDSSMQISENTASIADSLKELIVHISDQLAALWDQLYNYMHLPHLANDDKNTQSIIDTLTNGLSVEVENNDDNTEEIIHGYDQSGIDDANDSLNSSITEYSEAEKDVLDSVNENLNDFDFEESFDAYVSTIGTVSDFLQRMYESSGALKDVINIGFFLSIAGIVVGLYRFKEG